MDNLDKKENDTHDTETSSPEILHGHMQSNDDPLYKPDTEPSSEVSTVDTDFDIDAIVEKFWNNEDVSGDTGNVSPHNKAVSEMSDESFDSMSPKHEHTGFDTDSQAIQNMAEAVRELTEEVRRLRRQIDSAADPVSGYAKESPSDNSAFSAEPVDESPIPADAHPKKKKTTTKVISVISNILFYAVIVALVLGALLLRSTSKGEPFMFAGYSAANILTSSMNDVYPPGSLIITKQLDAKELMIGDDITFMVNEDTSITHRIIGITENYQGTDQRAFETKGTNNPNPDKELVAASNVVGKVIFSSKALGSIANFVKANWPILIFVLVVMIALITFLKWNVKKNYGDEDEDKEKAKKSTKNKKEKSMSHSQKGLKESERRNADDEHEES